MTHVTEVCVFNCKNLNRVLNLCYRVLQNLFKKTLPDSFLCENDMKCFPCIFVRYLDPDMYTMMEDNSDTIRSTKFKKLTKAICDLVSEIFFLVWIQDLV